MNSRKENLENPSPLGRKRGSTRTFHVPEGSDVLIRTPALSSAHGELYQFRVGKRSSIEDGEDPFSGEEQATLVFVPEGVIKVGRNIRTERKPHRKQPSIEDDTPRSGSQEHTKKTGQALYPTHTDVTRMKDGLTDLTPELNLRFAHAARERLQTEPTVENLSEYWRRVARFGSQWLEKPLTVPELPLSQKEYDEIRKQGQMVVCMPDGLFTDGAFPSLLPFDFKMNVPFSQLEHEEPVSGWFITGAEDTIPKPRVKAQPLIDGKRGMNMPAYMMLLLDRFIQTRTIALDRKNSCLLPGTTLNGFPIEVGFEQGEECKIDAATPKRAGQIGSRWYKPLVKPEGHILTAYYSTKQD